MTSFFIRLVLLFLAIGGWGSVQAEQQNTDFRRASLDGTWDFRPVSGVFTFSQATDEAEGQWSKIPVPSNWFLAGVEHHGSSIYRRNFTVIDQHKLQRTHLRFRGVDYAADIWVNDHFVGSHRGYFQSFEFDITDYLVRGENTLHVAVHSPNEEVGTVWSLRKQLIKGIFNHHDTRPGGAWSARGQEKNTGGIWASVELVTTGSTAIEALAIAPSAAPQEVGKIEVSFAVSSDGKNRPTRVVFRLTPKNFAGESLTLTRNLNRSKDGKFSFTLEHGEIKRWWPYELGAPNLYEIEATLYSKRGVSDVKRRTFGYRSINRDAKTGQWSINGKRYFLRGTNYIPTQWLSEMSPEDYDTDLGLMRGANINIVRVHAHIGAREFYDAADRMGMLVWQDFPLQWGYDDSESFLIEAKRQANDMVTQFDTHPSIIAWSMQNEPPWDADWMKYKYTDYHPDHNRKLTQSLYELVKERDKTRYVHSHSATAEHPWLGWYSGHWKDYGGATKENLITEFGAQALPNIDSLRRIFAEDVLWPDTEGDWEIWAYHNFQKHELTTIAGVEIGDDINSFIENTQSYQAKLTKFAAEAMRRQKYTPIGGIFQFMFNEDWPSVNWGIVDYWRNQKPGYSSLKSAYQPVLASLEWQKENYISGEDVEIGIWLINDLHTVYKNAVYELSMTTPTGVIPVEKYFIDIDADSIKKIAIWSRSFRESGNYSLSARVTSEIGEILSVNSFDFSVAE